MDSSAPWRELETSSVDDAAAPGSHARPLTWAAGIALAAILVVGSVGVVLLVGTRPGGHVDVVPAASESAHAEVSRQLIVVDVSGAVLRPGVYSLPPGSRVADAIAAAGGYSPDVDPRQAESRLNLAAKLVDAQLIVVPRRGDAVGSAGSGDPAPSGPLNLNTATAEQLDTLPGVGPATAAKILAAREQKPFATVDELVTRKIVTASVLAKIRGLVTAG